MHTAPDITGGDSAAVPSELLDDEPCRDGSLRVVTFVPAPPDSDDW